MSEHRSEPELPPTVAFRPAGVPIPDQVFAHSRGFVGDTAEVPERPGAVPPPAPTRRAPTESISARLRARFEQR
jgi:hypothetical protein